LQTYDIVTVKKAAYRFSDVMSSDIIPHSNEIECILHFSPEPKNEEQIERIVAAFRNEVLDQDLRSIIAKETEAIRNAVLAFAFSKTGLQDGE
jgi:His-Xaa-Ser system protein HxsD